MKLFIKFMMLTVVIAMAGPFFLKGPNGAPLMNFKDFIPQFDTGKLPSFSGAEEAASKTQGMANLRGDNKFYRWKDSNGVWQFSQTPPPEGVTSKIIDVDPNANIIQSMSKETINEALGLSEDMQQAANKMKPKEPDLDDDDSLFPSTVPLEKVPDLINDAKAVQDMSDQRAKMMERL